VHGVQGTRLRLSHCLDLRTLTPSKPKAPPAAAKAPSTPATSSTAAATPIVPAAPVPATAPSGDAPATPSPAPASTSTDTAPSASFNDPSALALGAQRDSVVQNMEAMGFPRADIDRAMAAAYYNPDRAVDYLLHVRFHLFKTFAAI
jgi:UV excision repair protein RAD23